jgi:ABC-2 type transport system ATP-binding protein
MPPPTTAAPQPPGASHESAPIIEVRGIRKSFGETKALDGVDVSVRAGTVLGLLGPNGAGKTTLVRILATLLQPDAGTAVVDGINVTSDPQAVRSVIGLAGQFAAVDDLLTGRENLEMVGRLYGLSRSDAQSAATQALERLSLTDAADRIVKTYSGGMRRRLDLGASLVFTPKVLILDEPTTGLDPRTRLELWEFIRDLVSSGTTVLLTTQYLEEADELADRIIVIDHGHVIAEGTAEELKQQLGGDVVEVSPKRSVDLDRLVDALRGLSTEGPLVDDASSKITLAVKSGSAADLLLAVARRIDESGVVVSDLGVRRPSLDDVFLALTGHTATVTPHEGVDTPKRRAGRRRGRAA